MSWQGLSGCDEIALEFARANMRKRLGGSFLFVGPNGVGKRLFAFALGKTLLCRRHFGKIGTENEGADVDATKTLSDEEELARFTPCGVCDSCKQFDFDLDSEEVVVPTHPDFHYVCKPSDKSLLPLSLLVGEKDDRMQSGLCAELNRTAFMGGRKIAVIDDADYFNAEGANALLKTLEEPPLDTIIILLGTSASKQLPTIRSRCQIFRFAPLPDYAIADILLRRGKVGSPEEAESVARNSGGSAVEAFRALDSELSTFQNALYTELAREKTRGVELATIVSEYVDKASKEAIVRRPRLQNALRAAIAFYRSVYLTLDCDGARLTADAGQRAAAPFVKKVVGRGRLTGERALDCVERTLSAIEQVDQNANLPYVIEAWAYDLAALTRR